MKLWTGPSSSCCTEQEPNAVSRIIFLLADRLLNTAQQWQPSAKNVVSRIIFILTDCLLTQHSSGHQLPRAATTRLHTDKLWNNHT